VPYFFDYGTGTKTCFYKIAAYDFSGNSGISDAISLTTAVTETTTDFQLYNPFPNPCNHSVAINYILSAQSYIQLAIFYSIGQKVVTLKDELDYTGRYSVRWAATGMPNGLYFYTLRTSNFIGTKKLLFMK